MAIQKKKEILRCELTFHGSPCGLASAGWFKNIFFGFIIVVFMVMVKKSCSSTQAINISIPCLTENLSVCLVVQTKFKLL